MVRFKEKYIDNIITLLAFCCADFIFSVFSIFNYQYLGIESSNGYVVYCIVVALLNLALCIFYLIGTNAKLNMIKIVMLLMPMIIFVIFLLTATEMGHFNVLAKTYFGYFLLWPVPAIYAAIYVNQRHIFKRMIKWFEFLMLIYSMASISAIIIPFIGGARFTTFGGATYQNASYISAFALGLNLYFSVFAEHTDRFKFTQNRLYKLMQYILIVPQLLGVIISGGRGGMVLVFVYFSYYLITVLKTGNRKERRPFYKILLLIGTLWAISVPILVSNDIFISGFNRVFEYISPQGISWEGSSNRDLAYANAWELILKEPLLGYGLFGFWKVSGYPHNLILEILLNGGIIYLIACIFFSIYVFKKLRKMIKRDNKYKLLIVLLFYPLTMLMFSGTYIQTSEFWFVLTFIIVYDFKSIAAIQEKKL